MGTMSGNIAKIESKTSNIETSQKDASLKMLELSKNDEKIFKEIVTFSALKSKFDSKIEFWDKKVDSMDFRKLETSINDEVKRISKEIQQISEKNNELKSSLKTNSKNEEQESLARNLESMYVRKEELKSMDAQITKLSTDFKKSNESNAANISKCEKKVTELEGFKQDTNSKLKDLTNMNEKLNGNIVNFTGLKSKFESKVENWDRKAEAQDLKKVEDHMSNEVNKIKQDVDNIKSKNMDIENQFKNKSNEQTNTIAKDLENKLIENIKQIENRL